VSIPADTAPVVELAAGLEAAATALEDPSSVLKRAGEEVARVAGPRTPRRTGRLAGSVSVTVDAGGAGIRWGVPYARHVNFGTVTQRAQPFATDALAATQTVLADLAAAWAGDILEAV